MIPFGVIYADFKRLWGGALVLIILIACAIAFSMVVNLQERALREGSARAADRFDLVIGAAGSETQLVLSTVFLQPSLLPLLDGKVLSELQHNPLVEWAAPLAFGDSYMGMPVIGTDDHLIADRLSTSDKVFQSDHDAIVGGASGLAIGDKIIPIHGQIGAEGAHQHNEASYTVTKVLPLSHDTWDKAILVPIKSVWDLHHVVHKEGDTHDEQFGAISAIIVKPKSIAGAYQLRTQYRGGESQAVFPGEVLVRLYGTLGDARQILSWVATGTQFLVVVAILMVVVIHLEQRKRQLGALRAFGAPQRGVISLVWCGLMLIMTIGMALGVLIGYLATLWISANITTRYGMALPVEIKQQDLLMIAIMWGVLAVILLVPALLTYRYSPAQALRG
ncbi:FtsX-like permease family protein [Pragia fontium]|uniref:ABC transport system permease protein n=1 Tax=Pragia fontium DSM 5563 = ATCC 49100 TaxID=1122977 RepID=A0AAJ5BHB8_9GAMM|nr:FtsX-like permease family protein [Pragia fontium]SFC89460.1 putative ABC transport system permease protein [Pragia fontium DSM 5563 = ATCC 49100]